MKVPICLFLTPSSRRFQGAVVVCSVYEERMYVTRLCEGRPEKDTGKVKAKRQEETKVNEVYGENWNLYIRCDKQF